MISALLVPDKHDGDCFYRLILSYEKLEEDVK